MKLISFLCIVYVLLAHSMARANRQMQENKAPVQTLSYRATYMANFQQLLDPYCFPGDSPTLIVTCYGRSMTLLGTSDPSIQCTQAIVPLVENGTSYECINTCTADTTPPCTSVYIASDDAIDGPFGSISYICEGDSIDEVDSVYKYEGGRTNGTCVASTVTQSRNFHLGRLGILCPTDTWTSKLVYDDTLFDCSSKGSFVADITEDPEDDIYVCFTGRNCAGQQCDVVYSDFYIHTQVDQIGKCVEKTSTYPGVSSFVPTPAPLKTNSTNTLTVQFEASWALLFDSPSSRNFCTMNENPSVIVACGSGSSIKYVSSTDSFMNCTKTSSNDMKCITSDTSNMMDQFVSLFYECAGPILPTSNVRYPASTIDCGGNAFPMTIRSSITLGVKCKASTNGEFSYHGDLLVECSELSHNFEVAYNKYGFTDPRYMCSSSVTVPIAASASGTHILPSVGITTDEYWCQDPSGCFTVQEGTVHSTTTPTTVPLETFPTALPSVTNSRSPSNSPTTVSPTTVSPTTASPTTVSPTTVSPTTMLPSLVPTMETTSPSVMPSSVKTFSPFDIGALKVIDDHNNCSTSSTDEDAVYAGSGRYLRRRRHRDRCRRCRDRRHCRNFFLTVTIIVGLIAMFIVLGPQQCIAGVIILVVDILVGWMILG